MEKIIEHFGSKAELAKALGVDRAAVSWWLRNGLPAGRAVEIERASNGKFKAVDITGVRNGSAA